MIKKLLLMFQPWKWFTTSKSETVIESVKKESQYITIRNYLEEYGTITSMYAQDNKLYRLKKEIYRMRKSGYTIKTQFLVINGYRHVKYTLIQTPMMKHELGI
jgi:pyruvate/2-oxoglutarate/acetoin dehydrogenase E1 component